jgi:hypothetical protein
MDTLNLCDERYNIQLYTISCWVNNDGDYSYIRDKLWEFVNIPNNHFTFDYKVTLMKYIDSEIIMMTNLSLMNNMELF